MGQPINVGCWFLCIDDQEYGVGFLGFLGMFRCLGITYAVCVKREIRRGLYTNLSFYTS